MAQNKNKNQTPKAVPAEVPAVTSETEVANAAEVQEVPAEFTDLFEAPLDEQAADETVANEESVETPEVTGDITLLDAVVDPNGVSANPAFVSFPADRHGFTSELKRVIKAIGPRIGDSEEKYNVFKETLAIGVAHIEARYALEAYRTQVRKNKAAKAAEAEAKAAK